MYGYVSMPQRKDPDIPIPVAVATCQWPGVSANQVEQQVTRKIERTIAENSKIRPGSAADFGIKSLTLPGLAIVYVQLDENLGNPKEQFSDINLKLSGINNQLPSGAGPIQFQSDFADTAALMLTVASPPVPEIEIALRARTVQRSLEDIRKARPAAPVGIPVSVVYGFPESIAQDAVRRNLEMLARIAEEQGVIHGLRVFGGPGLVGLDATTDLNDEQILEYAERGLAAGHPRVVAAWLEPTRLAKAIMFATVTNIVAYFPFLLLTGTTGDFLRSLPIVMTCSLVSSRIVSMTFIPLLGYYLLHPGRKSEPSLEQRRARGFTGYCSRLAGFVIDHRWLVFCGSLTFLALGAFLMSRLKQQFFPEDVQYWSYVNVRLPNDAPLSMTNDTARRAEAVIRETIAAYGRSNPGKDGRPRDPLRSLTSFVGGGGPRFWFSVSPELRQPNYARIIIQVDDKSDTPTLVGLLQTALSKSIAGAQLEVHQLQTNPVDFPVQVFLSGQADVSSAEEEHDIQTLRLLAGQVEDILRSNPKAAIVKNDWGAESSEVRLEVDPDKANLAGVTNLDVARSSTAAMSGMLMTTLREGDKQIPVIARLRMQERARLSDIQNLYVYSSGGKQKVPLTQISTIQRTMTTGRIRRQEHFRTISVQCFPAPGVLASEVLNPVLPRLAKLQASLPPGYEMRIGGERAKQQQGFINLAVVMGISVILIFVALVLQFNHAVKPLLVFAAVPYGVVGALLALAVMGTPFGFMAFLGIASLVGVIVSHVIVLFDFIEEAHEKGEPFKQAVVDAGIMRLRPVMITVAATVLALFPLALHGGPLWQPLCYSQIGGLAVATFTTLLLVPVLYSIFVLDLKIVRWGDRPHA